MPSGGLPSVASARKLFAAHCAESVISRSMSARFWVSIASHASTQALKATSLAFCLSPIVS